MKKVCNIKEYYALIAERKEKLGRLKTNCTLTFENIERYISLNRFLYEEVESGILFFSDEDSYYQAYYYLSDDKTFCLARKNKPVLIQNIYKEGKQNPFLSFLSMELKKNGFVLKDTLRHAMLENSDRLLETLEKSVKSILNIFDKKKFIYQDVAFEQIEELKVFMSQIDQIPFYQYPYYTDSEYMEESKQGRLSCIVNEDNRIVAARHLIIAGKKAYGWVGIDDKYKALYGFAPFILYKQLIYLRENNIVMCSWVKTTNVPSIHYHNRIGSIWTGQLEDEWLLDSK